MLEIWSVSINPYLSQLPSTKPFNQSYPLNLTKISQKFLAFPYHMILVVVVHAILLDELLDSLYLQYCICIRIFKSAEICYEVYGI